MWKAEIAIISFVAGAAAMHYLPNGLGGILVLAGTGALLWCAAAKNGVGEK